MRLKHNKKRNTAFLYEVLVKELTKSIVRGDLKNKEFLIKTIKEYFNKDTALYEELALYKVLSETHRVSPSSAEKLIFEVKRAHSKLDKEKLFVEQSALIKKINKASKTAFSNFVPNYKSLATIYQIFNQEASVKDRVLLEEHIFKRLSSKKKEFLDDIAPVDNLVYKTFVEKFNSEYTEHLHEEQKVLLNKYISSFADNGVELKIFLNEEIERLKTKVISSLKMKEIKEDLEMSRKTSEVLEILQKFKQHRVSKSIVQRVLKVQNLVREIGN